MSLVDDVDGVGGFCEFLETINGDDPEEKKHYKILDMKKKVYL